MSRDEVEAAVRRALAERDRRRSAHLFRQDTATAADNEFIDGVLSAADAYAAAAEPATGRRTPARAVKG